MIYALAPMDGVTDTVYRQIVKKIFDKYNKYPDRKLRLFTEFISSDGFFYNFEGVKDHLACEEYEFPLIAQIFGAKLDKLLHALKTINENYNFSGIELNIGCPSPKIMRLGAGSALMKDKINTLEIIKILSENSTKPFSIKTRSGLNCEDKIDQQKFIIESSQYCHLISIHGRTMSAGHAGEVDLDYVLEVKKNVNKNCKIIFNGGINEESLKDDVFLKKFSELDGIMIGQSAIGNPWIFVDHNPCMDERKQTILDHLELNIKYKGEHKGVIEFRKFIGNYIKGIDNASKFRMELMQARTFCEVKEILGNI